MTAALPQRCIQLPLGLPRVPRTARVEEFRRNERCDWPLTVAESFGPHQQRLQVGYGHSRGNVQRRAGNISLTSTRRIGIDEFVPKTCSLEYFSLSHVVHQHEEVSQP